MEHKDLQKLRNELEQARLEKEQAEHQLKRAENRLSYRENMKRKERTHQLIVLGAIMEQYFPELKGLSEERLGEIFSLLETAEIQKKFHEAICGTGKEVNA